MKMKKTLALIAAVIMTASLFTACGDSDTSDETQADTAINVITGGTEPQQTSPTEFYDPAAQLGIDTQSAVTDSNGNAVESSGAETTLPANHDDIVNMIENAQTGSIQQVQVMTEYNIDYKQRYAYNQLTAEEQELYTKILEAAKSLKIKVDVDDSVTSETWLRVYGTVCMQEPELFWLASSKASLGKMYYWEVDEEIIASRQAEIDAEVTRLLSAVNGMNEYETLKYFHDYIVLNNTFERTQEITEGAVKQTIYGGLVGGTIQCEGYAKTMMYLCDMAGIECVVVPGTNEEGGTHAWNCVKIGNNWYNLDTTWDDPILSTPDETNLRYNYFLVPDSWIHNISHFNISQKTEGTQLTYFTPPSCTSDEYNYFKVEGKLYSDAASADAAIKAEMKDSAANKRRVAEIRVTSKEIYDELTGKLSEYANWIKSENSSVTKVTSNCDPDLLIIELGIIY